MVPEIEQLVSMGFSGDLAALALESNGGDLHRATEWLLNQTAAPSHNPSTHSPHRTQPKINRFFNKKEENPNQSNKKQHAEIEIEIEKEKEEEDEPPSQLLKKRRKLPEKETHLPLSERMRPRAIEDVVGQDHLLSGASLLRASIASGRLPSLILWGPPGTGKTSMAKAIAHSCSMSYKFVCLSAVNCGVKEIREAVDEAKKLKHKRILLFLDEVHRFNKSQQEFFLPVIEDGSIVFIGATTENPSFHLVTSLLSRCKVLTLNPLKPHHVKAIINRAVSDLENGLSVYKKIELSDESIDFLSLHCDGDARVALNALEISATTAAAAAAAAANNNSSTTNVVITLDAIKESFQCKHLSYDKSGEDHYNLISALIKSMRGSDADASIYWLVRMLQGGEEPLYIARRLVRFASEDVGLADPHALTHAVSCYQACHFIGMPECDVIIAQCVAYMAMAKKSVAVYRAIKSANNVVKEAQNEGVPLHLRNATTKLMKEVGYGKGYIYTPDNPQDKSQTYLPDSIKEYKFLDWP